jgi:hypothetical protein
MEHTMERSSDTHILRRATRLAAGIVLVATGTSLAADRTSHTLDATTNGASADAIQMELHDALGLRDSRILTLSIADVPNVPFTTDIEIDGQAVTLDLQPYSVRSSNYQVLVQVAGGELVPHEPGPIRTMRGTVSQVEGSVVAASLLESGLHAIINLGPDGGNYALEPVSVSVPGAAADQYALYRVEDVESPGTCGTAPGAGDDGDEPEVEGGVAGTCTNNFWITELAIDADFEYFQTWGPNVSTVEAQINSIINGANVQYEEQVQITHEISALIIRSTSDDPYSDTTSFSGLLDEFRSHWLSSQGGVPRDVAHLFTGRDLDGSVIGVAFGLGQICTTGAYCLSQNLGGFSCRVDLTAHELGHLWNGSHCSCPSFTMNPSLTCSLQFHPTSTVPDIASHRDSRTCIENLCLPDNNTCAAAIDIVDGMYEFSNEFATTSAQPDILCGPSGLNQIDADVWFRYFAPCDGTAVASLCGSGFDTRMAIYETSCPFLVNTSIACSDDACGTQSEAVFNVEGGKAYFIRIGGTNGAEGSGMLTFSGPICIPAPLNNTCGNATTIVEGNASFTSIGATTTGPDESDGCGLGMPTQIENDVWFRFTAECDGTQTVSLCGTDYDTRIAVYNLTCPNEPGLVIACNEDGSCGSASEVSFPGLAGEVYRIRIGGAAGATGRGQITLTCNPGGNDCPTDTDGNGSTDIDDIVNVILDFGSTGDGNMDGFNGDVDQTGVVDIDDVVLLILNFGPCPTP